VNRIQTTFDALRAQGRSALIPYLMAGDPDLSTTEVLIPALENAGADLIEIGIPFSDPIADGPTIQKASERSLLQKTTLAGVLRLTKRIRKKTQIPLILMTYFNLIYQYGIPRFCQEAVRSGVDGVIIPDLPPEEAGEMVAAAQKSGLATIFLLAPTSNTERIKRVVSTASGFVYYVSLTGITGAALSALPEIRGKIAEIRRHSRLPIGVGFGISTPEQAGRISRWADGVIIGSALVRVIEQARGNPVRAAERFIRNVKQAMR
jgi:tryptophan synthase alpha chain